MTAERAGNTARKVQKAQRPVVPEIDGGHLMRLYLTGQHKEMLRIFLKAFQRLSTFSFEQLSVDLRSKLNTFAEQFLFYYLLPEIEIEDRFAEGLIRENATIANVIAQTDFKNADPQLQVLKTREIADRRTYLVKILTLLSARTITQFDITVFFDIDPKLTSLWWCHYLDLYPSSLADPNCYLNLNAHLDLLDERLDFRGNVNRTVFAATYIDPEKDRPVKEAVNEWIQRSTPKIEVMNEVIPKKVAVISGCWRDTHAVYKNQAHQIESLKEDYDMTFFPLRPNQTTSLFEKVDESLLSFSLDTRSLQDGKFEMVYFPDTGMTYQSVVLSNMRFAPLQVTSFGHSVSSFAGEIDYYIVGEDVEDHSKLEANYSETVVLTKGLGLIHKIPIERLKPTEPSSSRTLKIGCAWSCQKCSFPALAQMRYVVEESEVPVSYRFLVGSGVNRHNGLIPFTQSLVNFFGEGNVEVIPRLPYPEYLQALQQCHFLVDSFHFGGCNTIVDALFVGRPIITRMGSKWYNRIGGAQLKAIELDGLVAESEEEFGETLTQMLTDRSYREGVTKIIQGLELEDSVLFNADEAVHFKDAIDYLRENHEELKKREERTPILMREVL